MKSTPLNNWPLYASAVALLLLVWLTVRISISRNHGYLVYALDDAYIHLSIAKNLSHFGIWGVTRYGFTPASSSLLWTLLLSLAFSLVGMHQIVPLLLNLVFSLLVLVAVDAILCWYKGKDGGPIHNAVGRHPPGAIALADPLGHGTDSANLADDSRGLSCRPARLRGITKLGPA